MSGIDPTVVGAPIGRSRRSRDRGVVVEHVKDAACQQERHGERNHSAMRLIDVKRTEVAGADCIWADGAVICG